MDPQNIKGGMRVNMFFEYYYQSYQSYSCKTDIKENNKRERKYEIPGWVTALDADCPKKCAEMYIINNFIIIFDNVPQNIFFYQIFFF